MPLTNDERGAARNHAGQTRMNDYINCTRTRWVFVLSIIFVMDCYIHMSIYNKAVHTAEDRKMMYHINGSEAINSSRCTMKCIFLHSSNLTQKESTPSSRSTEPIITYYEYPLVNSTSVTMEYSNGYNSSYYWFISMKHLFKNLGDEDTPKYPKNTPVCQLNNSTLGPIKVNKTELKLEWVKEQNSHVKFGGYYAPAHCRSTHRVAVIVPYRDRRINLIIFLRYLHPLLKKQLLDYRIFVIEQYGTEKFNKGTLYNIAFLETQRFGKWDCLIFHDVDLIPEDERISYSCPEHPTHISSAVQSWGYSLPYNTIFGGVTVLAPAQYEAVNGYSNFYWNWGGEDDDMYQRIISKNYTVLRYNTSIARYTTLPHPWNECGNERKLFLMLSRLRFLKEGLPTTKYNLINITKVHLYTHILAEVNPTKIKLDTKNLMQRIINLHGKSIEYGRHELKLKGIPASVFRRYYIQRCSTTNSNVQTAFKLDIKNTST